MIPAQAVTASSRVTAVVPAAAAALTSWVEAVATVLARAVAIVSVEVVAGPTSCDLPIDSARPNTSRRSMLQTSQIEPVASLVWVVRVGQRACSALLAAKVQPWVAGPWAFWSFPTLVPS